MEKPKRHYLFLFLVAAIIIALDQITKAVVIASLPVEGQAWAPWDWLLPYARIIHWTNTGVAFGMFQGLGTFFIFLAIIVGAAIVYYYPRVAANDPLLRLAMGLQLGGAMGNLVDRLTRDGKVVDFISVGTFPVFNVADSSITVGVLLLVLAVWLQERREKQALLMRVDAAAEDSTATEHHEAA